MTLVWLYLQACCLESDKTTLEVVQVVVEGHKLDYEILAVNRQEHSNLLQDETI